MANGVCDICGIRPATVRAQVVSEGRRQIMELCDVDYRRLARQHRPSSPLESLFGGRSSLFDDFFGSDFFGESPPADAPGRPADERSETEGGGTPIPVRAGRGRSRGRGARSPSTVRQTPVAATMAPPIRLQCHTLRRIHALVMPVT